ncbi:MAG: hypothetical protein AAF789_02020 [Bacteroidota bacterium]
MIAKKHLFLFALAGIIWKGSFAQVSSDMREVERLLEASTKQVNQFFRRFNGEEDKNGKRLYPKDKSFRSVQLRKKFLPLLYDEFLLAENEERAEKFAKAVISKEDPFYLDFRGGNWFTEVRTVFEWKDKQVQGLLYLNLEPQGQGYAWTIHAVDFDHISSSFKRDSELEEDYFLHPMSHELDFMTFRKAFQNTSKIAQYTSKIFEVDQLSVFLAQIQNKELRFKTVKEVKFHFLQKEGWYFGISNFNRTGYNSGWLISSLTELRNADERKQLEDYLYGRN